MLNAVLPSRLVVGPGPGDVQRTGGKLRQPVEPLCSQRGGTGPYWGDLGVSCIPIPIQEQLEMFNPMPIQAGFGQSGVSPWLGSGWIPRYPRKEDPSMKIRLQMHTGVRGGNEPRGSLPPLLLHHVPSLLLAKGSIFQVKTPSILVRFFSHLE